MRAARWIRVSSGGQNEMTQAGVIDAACAREGFTVTGRTFRLHDVSASKGEQQAAQDAAVEAVAAGEFDVLVATESDRLDRRGPKAAYAFLWAIELAGGRVHVANDPAFGSDDLGSEVLSTVRMAAARDEVKLKSRRVREKFDLIDDSGRFRGAVPPGYAVAGEKYARYLVPAPARREVQRKRMVNGEKQTITVTLPSADDVARAISDAATTSSVVLGKRLGVTPDTVRRMVRSRIYSSGIYRVRRADGVIAHHRCEPLVTPAVQSAAVAALETRRTGDSVISRALAKNDFSGALRCPCGGRMYRFYSGAKKRANGTRDAKDRRYRCAACRKSVAAGAADAAVHELMAARTSPWMRVRVIPGSDSAADLERVMAEYRELGARGLDFDKEDAERARLRAEITRLRETEPVPARTVAEFATGPDGRHLSDGDRWLSLDTSQRRAYLASGEVTVFVRTERRGGPVIAECIATDDAAGDAG